MLELFLIKNKKRKLSYAETVMISSLYDVAKIQLPNFSSIFVRKINNDTGTIRAAELSINERTHAVSSCAFYDEDGAYVEVILFLSKDNKFGELYIWKVTDTPVRRLPENLNYLLDFQKI